MPRYVIEREMPEIGSAAREAFKEASERSREVLAELGTDIQWEHSYVTADKIFCVYLAKNEALIHKHAEIAGFPANTVTEVKRMIDPTTAEED